MYSLCSMCFWYSLVLHGVVGGKEGGGEIENKLRATMPVTRIYHNIRCPHLRNALNAILTQIPQKEMFSPR